MRCHTLRTIDEFFAHESDWRRAESAGHVPDVFVTFDWLATYWRIFGSSKSLAIVTASGDSLLTACAPLMVTSPAPGVRRLEFIGAGIHDFSDFIGSGGDDSARLLWDHILGGNGWDALRLQQLKGDSPALRQAPATGVSGIDRHALRSAQQLGEACPVLTLPPSWDEYYDGLGRNLRYDLRRYARKVANDFRKVHYQLVRTSEELNEAFAALVRLHGERWRRRGLPGVLASPRRQRFQLELAQTLLRRDRLRMFVLRLDDAPTAVLLNYWFGGRYYFYVGGFDVNRERYRPGTLLFAQAIRQAIEEGATEFDFLRGQEEYKYRFGAVDRPHYHLAVTRNTLRSRAATAHAHLEAKIMARARRFAEGRYRKSEIRSSA